MSSSYSAKDITVLEGLDPVRKRPGMYIGGVGSAGLHHLVWEILDNAVDEAMNGFASTIAVTLHEDGSTISVTDDGRGIPVDKHAKTNKSALEVIFTVLHAGGKFEGTNYKTAGGLHGVGASVVNALSKELVATVKRDGHQWELRFAQGKPAGSLKKLGAARGTGTTVRFHPDPVIFPKIEFDADVIRERLEVVSYLHKGVKVSFENEVTGDKHVFTHEEGLVAYLRKIVGERSNQAVHDAPFAVDARQRAQARRRAAVDRVHRRAPAQLRQRHPHRQRRHARKRAARGAGQGRAQLHRDAQPHAQGRDAHGRRHPRGPHRRAQRVHRRAAVPGPDQGPAEQPRAAVGRRRRDPSRARALAESQHQRRRVHRRAHHPVGARARGQPRRAAGSDAQDRRPRPAWRCPAS